MLQEREWMTINNILLELYTLNDIDSLANKFMRIVGMMIPYTKGYFVLINKDRHINEKQSCFIGMDEVTINKYVNYYYDKDYLKYLYEIAIETTVYKDTGIMSEDVRKNTDFYRKFLEPQDIPYGCGILIVKNGRILGIFNLFRGKRLGDFSDKDIFILEILKKHIENMVYNAIKESCTADISNEHIREIQKKYSLTERESQVLELLSNGMSNEEICKRLIISLSTVKKHIYNLYNKTGVNSRSKLISLLFKGD